MGWHFTALLNFDKCAGYLSYRTMIVLTNKEIFSISLTRERTQNFFCNLFMRVQMHTPNNKSKPKQLLLMLQSQLLFFFQTDFFSKSILFLMLDQLLD